MSKTIDGKRLSEKFQEKLIKDVENFNKVSLFPLCLSVILVGDNPASQTYVENKQKSCKKVGIISQKHHLPVTTSPERLEDLINTLNNTDTIHGILLQLPLPPHLNALYFLKKIHPKKDVDGLHPENLGKLVINQSGFIPCTAKGIIQLIHSTTSTMEGKNVVVLGRSILVGKPTALLSINENATVTLAHSHTKNLPSLTSQADILIVAIGKPHFINSHHVREGATIIDVGINKQEDGRMVGDVDFNNVIDKVAFITPVPGGVGPMTVTNLLLNTLQAGYLSIEK